MTFVERIQSYIRAAYPALAINTAEEQRVVPEILEATKGLPADIAFWSWDAASGLNRVSPTVQEADDTEDLLAACNAAKRIQDAVVVLKDAQTWPLDRDPQLARALREVIQTGPEVGRVTILVGPGFQPHATIERLVTMIDYALPDEPALRQIAEEIAESARQSELVKGSESVEVTEDLVRAMGGMTSVEAANALTLSLVEGQTFDPEVVYREKVSAVRRGGLLEIVDPDPRGLDAIGGFGVLKPWIQKRRRAYSKEAQEFGLPRPRGCLMVGCPGTGKSLAAKCVGTALGLPTLKLDVASLFTSLVGQSEERTRNALATAEAMAPCVLFVDEIDKGLGGIGGGTNDSGVSTRVLGTILTWMQESKAQVFTIASANRVTGLPPELLRKGRWDELWAVDLPDVADRVEILRIHVKARGRDPEGLGIAEAAAAAVDFSGSELEAVVNEALFDAFDAGRDLEAGDLLAVAERTVPLAKTAADQINGIRAWAKGRARFVADPRDIPIEVQSAGKRRLLGVAALVEEDEDEPVPSEGAN